MDLILWRHAEAEEATGTMTDLERRLTARGEKQARKIAKWLVERLPKASRILVSPATRTQQTAHALHRPFEIEPRISPAATVQDHIATVNWPMVTNTVLIVGHQPALGRLAALLLSGTESDWIIKKGGLWWFSHRVSSHTDRTFLHAVMNPDFPKYSRIKAENKKGRYPKIPALSVKRD
jgi:phosphohistidine phosphatase